MPARTNTLRIPLTTDERIKLDAEAERQRPRGSVSWGTATWARDLLLASAGQASEPVDAPRYIFEVMPSFTSRPDLLGDYHTITHDSGLSFQVSEHAFGFRDPGVVDAVNRAVESAIDDGMHGHCSVVVAAHDTDPRSYSVRLEPCTADGLSLSVEG